MRRFKRHATSALLVGVLVFTLQFLLPTSVAAQIKFLVTVDYPLRQKDTYLSWVKSIVPALQAPHQIKRVASYDNYFGTWPHRFVEFEFDNMEVAADYFERPEIREIFEDVVNHGERLAPPLSSRKAER